MAVTVPCKAEDVYQLLSHQTACRNHRTPSEHSAADVSQWLRLCVSVKPTAVFEMHHSHACPPVQSRAKDDSLDHEFFLLLSRTVFFALLLAYMVTWKIYYTLSYLRLKHCFGLEPWRCAHTPHPAGLSQRTNRCLSTGVNVMSSPSFHVRLFGPLSLWYLHSCTTKPWGSITSCRKTLT